MRKIKILAALLAAVALSFIATSSPAGADDDLDCGDPGTSPNMPVEAGDPHGLDGDGNGIGCEDDSEPIPTTVPATPTTQVAEPTPAAPSTTVTTAPSGTPDELPRTGSSSNIKLGLGAAVLLALGGLAIAGRNKLRTMAS